VVTKFLLLFSQQTTAKRVDRIQSTPAISDISQYPYFSAASSCQLQLKVQAEGPPLDGCPGMIIEEFNI
jgi:hypothetical protein